ncbi:unnamed protein product [Fusarium graminearum]|uniref:RING-type E3 ubiquitin transferase n=1 Tax=Gibberella zeae TaxID=5518 RepID=A0A4E9EI52_GIBZA|nr:unnamed protein product [Fusarium graminearum]CAG1989299.1 unnamed protein product [Fusarium graminearum]
MVSLWWDHAYIMHSHKQDVHHKDTSAAGGEETETQPISVHQKFGNQERFQRLRCDHMFHTRCVDTWLRRNQDDCPLCKSTRQLMTIYDDDTQRTRRDLAWFKLIGSVSRETQFTYMDRK